MPSKSRKAKKPLPKGKIEKPEDKIWLEWYNKLSEKDHEKFLAKLGISKEEMADFKKELKKESASH
jgi:hypothetical protein